MQLEKRALYNLLRSNWLKDPTLEVKSWQVEDYRMLLTEELWDRLKALGILIDDEQFRLYIENCDHPEELIDCLWTDESDREGYDQAYLILFELWRRITPEKKTLSLFCDELDHRIDRYESSKEEDDEYIQEALIELEDILDNHVDEGADPKYVFSALTAFCAHDIESFLYNYISEQIAQENEVYASELIDSFYDYCEDILWFNFLKARTVARSDSIEGNRMLKNLSAENPDLDLLLEMACSMIHDGDAQLFVHIVLQALKKVQSEEEFQELLAIAADFYRCLDQERQEELLQEIFAKRADYDLSLPLDPKDSDIALLKEILDSRLDLQNQ